MMDLVGKKLIDGDYHSVEEDFYVDKELMVMITLHEYRDLVRAAADEEIKTISSQRYEAITKTKELEAQLLNLKLELSEKEKQVSMLQTMLEQQGSDLPWDNPAYDADPDDLTPAGEVEGADE